MLQKDELPVSFEKTVTVPKNVSLHFKWILSDTEPEAPDGYQRAADMDFDFGQLGKYYAFLEV